MYIYTHIHTHTHTHTCIYIYKCVCVCVCVCVYACVSSHIDFVGLSNLEQVDALPEPQFLYL